MNLFCTPLLQPRHLLLQCQRWYQYLNQGACKSFPHSRTCGIIYKLYPFRLYHSMLILIKRTQPVWPGTCSAFFVIRGV
ncbi:putative Cytoplasmic 60S subunit biogenesis factor REI1 like protein [Fusarium oxysporum f. sp. albedinis]|nr:putative Cytoplasmic 60S subunit biogenesis factor REI1 like protein [Fusarium oxysporum f. sp. albedinis]